MARDRTLTPADAETVSRFLAILDNDDLHRLETDIPFYGNAPNWWLILAVKGEIKRRQGR